LPEDILEKKINAEFKNGVLQLLIPKNESKPLKISVNID